MNYNVVSLGGQSQYDLNGVRFDGKSFMFWKKKGNQAITEVIAIFDKRYENIPVADGRVILSLKGLTNYNDVKVAIQIFQQIMGSKQIKVSFVVGNENERKVAEALGRELGLSYQIENIDQAVKKMEEDMAKKAPSNLNAGDGQMIEKYDNGKLKQVTVQNGALYENNGLLNTEEEKASLFREWAQDPVKREELSRMSAEAREALLTQTVLNNRKAYRMESAREQIANDKVGSVAMNKATQEDGLVNTELGIVQNNVSNPNQYSAVEQHGDNIQVVNTGVQHSQISANGMSSNMSGGTGVSESYNVETKVEEEKMRSIETQIFYISPAREVYDSKGNQIGMIGQGYSVDPEDNTLLKNGEKIGSIGDYKDMGRAQSNVYAKPMVRTLKNPEQDKRAGMVSLPVIIFVLSALLLIVSGVLLFVVD